MLLSERTIYEFGDFRLDPAENLLVRDGQPVSLKPKAFFTLVFLIENRGRLVEKSELMDEVWAGSFVEEAAISKCIWTVRAALDDVEKKQLIQTVPKRGYRFVGDVTVIPSKSEASDTEIISPETITTAQGEYSSGDGLVVNAVSQLGEVRSEILPKAVDLPHDRGVTRLHGILEGASSVNKPMKAMAAFAVFAIAILGAFSLYKYQWPAETATVTTLPKIAVLPLKPVDPETRDRGLEFAIADALILKLSESKAFEVKRLNTVRKFIDLEQDPVDAGRDLNVQYVLSSHYQVVEGRIRVTSQLLNVDSGISEHTFKADAGSSSIFEIQDAVANDIGNAVFSKFGTPISVFAARRGTENEEAYSLYQQAWYLIDKGTAEESARAAKLLDRVVEIDPNYSQAWAVRSHAYCQFAHQGGEEPLSAFTTAEPMLERSMSLDPNNAMAYTIRGAIQRDFHWNLPQAINDLQRAIDLDPSVVLAHRLLAGAYYRNGQFAEALESEKRAVDLHPTSLPDQWFLGVYLVAAGHKAEGVAQLNRVAEMNDTYSPVYNSLWEIYHIAGDHSKAYENFIKMKEVSGFPAAEMAMYKKSLEKSGWPGVLRAELEWVLSKEPKGQYCKYKYYIASLAALSGENDLAFHYIDEAIRYRLISVSFLKVDPKFAGLRNDPRFAEVINRVGLSGRS